MYSQASLIHDYLSITSLRIPDKIALVCDEQRLTYGQIDQASSKLALSLRNAGAQRGDRIAIFAHNSVETVISFWAVMKANCVLSIINPLNKEEKLNWMLNNAEAKIMITDMSLAKTVANTLHSVPSLTKVFISGSKGLADIIQTVSGYKIDNHVDVLSWEDFTYQYGGSLPALPRENIISDLAMIIYTSGTTGEPKGVMMNHENMLFATESVNDYLNN
ncbi:MAG TPA: class I adenylate-forming enzyme family protein, partial [Psychromonas sp.]